LSAQELDKKVANKILINSDFSNNLRAAFAAISFRKNTNCTKHRKAAQTPFI